MAMGAGDRAAAGAADLTASARRSSGSAFQPFIFMLIGLQWARCGAAAGAHRGRCRGKARGSTAAEEKKKKRGFPRRAKADAGG